MKFKVGDKAKIIGNGSGNITHFYNIGNTVEVISGDRVLRVKRVSDSMEQNVYEDDLELIKAKKKKRLYKNGEYVVIVKDRDGENPQTIGKIYKVIDYHKGYDQPYRLYSEHVTGLDKYLNAHVSELRRVYANEKSMGVGISMAISKAPKIEYREKVIIKYVDRTRKEEDMGTIREKIRELARSKDEKNAIKSGFLSDNGNLTDVGRRTLLDYIWEGDEDLRKRVFADITSVMEEECKSKSKK